MRTRIEYILTNVDDNDDDGGGGGSGIIVVMDLFFVAYICAFLPTDSLM